MNDLLPRILHPEDKWPAFLVLSTVITGLFLLCRVVLQGLHRNGTDLLSSKEYKRILIPVFGERENNYQSAVDLANQLSSPSTEVLVIYLLPVPRSKPIDAEFTPEQNKTVEDLQRISSLVQAARLRPNSQVRRCRSVWDELRRTIEEEKVGLTIFVSKEDSAELATQWRAGLHCDLVVPGGATG